MNILIGFLYVVEVLVCLLLAFAVMLQKPKEGGLGGAFGGGALEASLGADAGNILIKATAFLGTIFIVNTLVLASFTARAHKKSMMSGVSVPAPVQAPAIPSLPEAAPAPAAEAPAPVAVPSAAVPVAPAAEAPAAPAAPAAAAPAAPAPAEAK